MIQFIIVLDTGGGYWEESSQMMRGDIVVGVIGASVAMAHAVFLNVSLCYNIV